MAGPGLVGGRGLGRGGRGPRRGPQDSLGMRGPEARARGGAAGVGRAPWAGGGLGQPRRGRPAGPGPVTRAGGGCEAAPPRRELSVTLAESLHSPPSGRLRL